VDRTRVRLGRRTLIYFGGCDYFRLGRHPQVMRAARRAMDDCGINVAASRLTTGNHRLYQELESSLAQFFGAEAALLVSSGYMTNFAVAQALAGEFTHALIDARAHACLHDAARFLDCPVNAFAHRDATDLARKVRRLPSSARVVLLTDGLFSHDGSVAPLRAWLEVLPRQAVLLVDDAHGAGVLGAHGRGTIEHEAVSRAQIIQTITLSKAFGAYGGAVLGSLALRDRIIRRSGLFAGNTPLPLPLAAAALQSVRMLRVGASLRLRLRRNTDHVKTCLRAAGVPIPDTPSPIVPLLPKNPAEAAALQRALLDAGIHPPFIQYPGGPPSGYFRFALSSVHTQTQLDRLVAAVVSVLR
jgi:7-keto-8-aminopelargonate synthetase-like enzyme